MSRRSLFLQLFVVSHVDDETNFFAMLQTAFSRMKNHVWGSENKNNASRAQILKKAAEYIQFMRKKNNSHQQDIEDLRRQNNLLEAQIRTLEKAKSAGSYNADTDGKDSNYNETESDTSDMEGSISQRRVKKMKVGAYH